MAVERVWTLIASSTNRVFFNFSTTSNTSSPVCQDETPSRTIGWLRHWTDLWVVEVSNSFGYRAGRKYEVEEEISNFAYELRGERFRLCE